MDRYACILADPPWARSDGDAPVKPNRRVPGEPDRFPTMKGREIAALPIGDLAADRAHLWMWSLNTTMEQAYVAIRAWGFVPKGLVTWCKPNGMTGRRLYFWTRSEQLIFASRGTPAMLPENPVPSTWFTWARPGRWAQKPDDSYTMIESVSPGPRLELFARYEREGWDQWGNEVAPSEAVEHLAAPNDHQKHHVKNGVEAAVRHPRCNRCRAGVPL